LNIKHVKIKIKIRFDMYRIMWSMPNGDSGHGDYCLSLEEGQAWIERMTKMYPDMKHWLDERV